MQGNGHKNDVLDTGYMMDSQKSTNRSNVQPRLLRSLAILPLVSTLI
jgi:hypothetical protein